MRQDDEIQAEIELKYKLNIKRENLWNAKYFEVQNNKIFEDEIELNFKNKILVGKCLNLYLYIGQKEDYKNDNNNYEKYEFEINANSNQNVINENYINNSEEEEEIGDFEI